MLFSFYFRDPKINNDNSTIQRQTRAHALRFVFRETSGDIVELKATRTTTTMMMTCPRVRSIKNGSKSGIHFIRDIGAAVECYYQTQQRTAMSLIRLENSLKGPSAKNYSERTPMSSLRVLSFSINSSTRMMCDGGLILLWPYRWFCTCTTANKKHKIQEAHSSGRYSVASVMLVRVERNDVRMMRWSWVRYVMCVRRMIFDVVFIPFCYF